MNEQEQIVMIGDTPMDLSTAIEYLQFNAEETRKFIEKMLREAETAKHYKTVYEYVVNLDMQEDMLEALKDAPDNYSSWGELSYALSELRDVERGYKL